MLSNRFATFLSYAFHPIVMPSLVAFPLVFLCEGATQLTTAGKAWLMLYIMVLSVVIPVFIMLYLRHFNYISALHMPNKRERVFPLLVNASLLGFLGYGLSFQSNNVAVGPLFFAVAICCVVLSVITYYYQISLHAAGVGGSIIFLWWGKSSCYSPVMPFLLMVAVLLAGMVLSARMSLKSHSAAESWLGFLVGSVFSASIFLMEHLVSFLKAHSL